MYFVIHNSVVLSKILKIVVPLEQNFEKTDFYSIKLVILIIIDIGKKGQAISFSIAESLKKDVVPKRKYYVMVKLFEKLPKLVEKKNQSVTLFEIPGRVLFCLHFSALVEQ